YRVAGRTADAIAGFHAALRLQPVYPEAYNNLAVLYCHLGQPDPAIEFCRKGLEQDPKSGPIHANLATALGQQGRLEEALAVSRRAAALSPDMPGPFTNLLYGLNYVPDYDPEALFQEHLEWARRHAEPLTAQAAPHANDRAPDRRLRIGYVSPYFRDHAVNFFTEPLITSHDHREF